MTIFFLVFVLLSNLTLLSMLIGVLCEVIGAVGSIARPIA